MSYDALEELLKDCTVLVRIRAFELDALLRRLGLDLSVVSRNGKMRYGYGIDRDVCLLVPSKWTLKLGLLEDDGLQRPLGMRNRRARYSYLTIAVDAQLAIPALRTRIEGAKKAYCAEVTRDLELHTQEVSKSPIGVWSPYAHKAERALTDDQYLESMGVKHILGEVFLGVLRYVPVDDTLDEERYNKALQRALGFQKQADCTLLRSAVDLLEDTQWAIDEVRERGLYVTKGSYAQHRESYLRLYGVLNAVYLQVSSIEDLMRMFSCSKLPEYKQSLRNLPLLKARHSIGAHALNNREVDGDNSTVTHNRLTHTSLSKWGNALTVISERSGVIDVDLMDAIDEYEKLSTAILIELAEVVVKNRIVKKSDGKTWLQYRLKHLRKRSVQAQPDGV